MVHPVAEADERSPFGRLTAEEFYDRHGVAHSSSTFANPRGLRIFTQRWVPGGGAPVLGAIVVVHGFTGESSWTVQLTAVHFAKAGFAVAAVDHQGHGFSEGLQGHIPDIGPVLDDCEAAFAPFRADYPPPLPCFLYGESLGGAISLLLHLRNKGRWRDGAVLNGAMCGVSPRFKPPWPLEHLLWAAAAVVPTWRVAYTRGSIPERSFKVEWKRTWHWRARAAPRPRPAPPRRWSCSACAGSCRRGSRGWSCHCWWCTAARTRCVTQRARRSCTAAPGARTRRCACTPGCGTRSSASRRRTWTRCSATSSTGSRPAPPPAPSSGSSSMRFV